MVFHAYYISADFLSQDHRCEVVNIVVYNCKDGDEKVRKFVKAAALDPKCSGEVEVSLSSNGAIVRLTLLNYPGCYSVLDGRHRSKGSASEIFENLCGSDVMAHA